MSKKSCYYILSPYGVQKLARQIAIIKSSQNKCKIVSVTSAVKWIIYVLKSVNLADLTQLSKSQKASLEK